MTNDKSSLPEKMSTVLGPFSATWKLATADLLNACPQDGCSIRSDRFVPWTGVEFEISAHRHSNGFLTLRIVLAEAPPLFAWTKGALVWELSARLKETGVKYISKTGTTVWEQNEIVAGPAPAATFEDQTGLLTLARLRLADHIKITLRHNVEQVVKTYKLNTVVEAPPAE